MPETIGRKRNNHKHIMIIANQPIKGERFNKSSDPSWATVTDSSEPSSGNGEQVARPIKVEWPTIRPTRQGQRFQHFAICFIWLDVAVSHHPAILHTTRLLGSVQPAGSHGASLSRYHGESTCGRQAQTWRKKKSPKSEAAKLENRCGRQALVLRGQAVQSGNECVLDTHTHLLNR